MNRKVFFVDDEKNVLSSITRLFRKSEIEIFIYEDPLEAINMLSVIEPAVVVSDYRMPDMTGIAFLERVKSLYPETIRIILSAYTDLAITEAAINTSTVDVFLQKPWDEKELVSEVENAVRLNQRNRNTDTGYGIF